MLAPPLIRGPNRVFGQRPCRCRRTAVQPFVDINIEHPGRDPQKVRPARNRQPVWTLQSLRRGIKPIEARENVKNSSRLKLRPRENDAGVNDTRSGFFCRHSSLRVIAAVTMSNAPSALKPLARAGR